MLPGKSYSLGVVHSSLLSSDANWSGIASHKIDGSLIAHVGEICDYIFYNTNNSIKCAKHISIHFDRTDALILRCQSFQSNIACFSFIKYSTSFTSKVPTLTVNIEGIRQKKTHTRFNLYIRKLMLPILSR